MLNSELKPTDFLDFSDLLTGYRLSMVLLLARRADIFERVGTGGCQGDALLAATGWERDYGQRFLRCLCGLGLLTEAQGRYRLSAFAARYLHSASDQFQGRTMDFEQQLLGSWQQLEATLRAGRRVFAAEEKSPETYQQALRSYLGAMDEAARIRAAELWEALPAARAAGTILDLGAGSGAYLLEFLTINPQWRAIFADLPEVVAATALRRCGPEILARISWCGGNLLAEDDSLFDGIADQSCDLVLLSNLVHCQGQDETRRLLQRAAAKTGAAGQLVIHDFFTDNGWRGALYDLHMMLNTYNGRTYPLDAIRTMAADWGLASCRRLPLPSGSTALVLARNP